MDILKQNYILNAWLNLIYRCTLKLYNRERKSENFYWKQSFKESHKYFAYFILIVFEFYYEINLLISFHLDLYVYEYIEFDPIAICSKNWNDRFERWQTIGIIFLERWSGENQDISKETYTWENPSIIHKYILIYI